VQSSFVWLNVCFLPNAPTKSPSSKITLSRTTRFGSPRKSAASSGVNTDKAVSKFLRLVGERFHCCLRRLEYALCPNGHLQRSIEFLLHRIRNI
jgi:hypothetical protein